MIKAVISGDIVASTSLSNDGRKLIEETLERLFRDLEKDFNTYSRILRGDYIECVVPHPQDALRVALVIKCYVKSIPVDLKTLYNTDKRAKAFKTFGIRLAIGYGQLSNFKPDEGIIDGEAIYLSGRTINEFSSYNKERIVIKNTLFFVSNEKVLNDTLDPILSLLDVIINQATAKQCRVIYLKLMNNSEKSIVKKLGIAQSVVNQHSTSIGWNAIEKAVNYFHEIIKNH